MASTKAFDALGRPELRETFLFARRSDRPVTAAELADALGVPRTVARFRLERLADAGLLLRSFERRSGRTGPGAGRPAKTYAVAPETTSIEFPPRRYETLMRLLVDNLPQRNRAERLTEIGAAYGHELAAAARLRPVSSTPAALRAVCRALGRLGFQASVAEATDQGGVIETQTCPLRPLVTRDPEARALDQGMWQGLVTEALGADGDITVTCDATGCHDHDSPCRLRVTCAPTAGPRA